MKGAEEWEMFITSMMSFMPKTVAKREESLVFVQPIPL
jgi:hypothetical protein